MKNLQTFTEFLNESLNEASLYGVETGQENEVIYNSIAKKTILAGKKMKIKWKDGAGFERLACFVITDIISNDLVVFKKYPGDSFNDRDAKTHLFKKGFGIVSLLKNWSGGKFNSKDLPSDVVSTVNDLGLKP